MTLVERVARAIAESHGKAGHTFEDDARAAIEAIVTGMTREDDEFMRVAVKGFHDISERDWRSTMPRDLFSLAITRWLKSRLKTALQEPTK